MYIRAEGKGYSPVFEERMRIHLTNPDMREEPCLFVMSGEYEFISGWAETSGKYMYIRTERVPLLDARRGNLILQNTNGA